MDAGHARDEVAVPARIPVNPLALPERRAGNRGRGRLGANGQTNPDGGAAARGGGRLQRGRISILESVSISYNHPFVLSAVEAPCGGTPFDFARGERKWAYLIGFDSKHLDIERIQRQPQMACAVDQPPRACVLALHRHANLHRQEERKSIY